ncbi:MAG: hypothetical protein WA945_00540, partial [Arcobacteraceae bacterium]
MIDNITQTVTALTTFPKRTEYKTSRLYAISVQAWLGENKNLSAELAVFIPQLQTFIDQINTDIDEINDITPILLGAINYKGEYVPGETYGKNESVSILDTSYVSKIDNNEDTPPSTNWRFVPSSYSKDETDNAINAISSTLATLTKSFTENEEIEIPLSKDVLVPNVSVTKEIPQLGLTSNVWDVDGDDYDQESDVLVINNSVAINKNIKRGIDTITDDSISLNFGSRDGTPRGMFIVDNDSKLFSTGYSNDRVYSYTLASNCTSITYTGYMP